MLMLPARAVRPEAREDCGDNAVRSACAAAVPELRGAAGACRDHRGARLGGGVLPSRPGEQDTGLDLHPLFQGEARQGLDLGLAAAEVASIAFLGQEQEAFEVAAAVVDDAVTFPVSLWRRSRRPSLPPVWCGAPFAPQGEGWIVQYWNTCPPPTARKTTASPRPTITSSGVGRRGVYRWRGDYGLLEQGRRRCPHISSRLGRQTRLAKSRQTLGTRSRQPAQPLATRSRHARRCPATCWRSPAWTGSGTGGCNGPASRLWRPASASSRRCRA